MEEVVWMGPQPTMEDRIQKIGTEKSISPDALKDFLAGKQVHYLPPYHADRVLFLKELLGKIS
jgi:Xaa-Pro aminopeptidase